MEDITHLAEPLCGVYILWGDNICIYVGASNHVLNRLPHHKSRRRNNAKYQWKQVTFEACKPEELVQKEFIAIRQYQPRFNKQNIGGPIKRIDLKALGLRLR